MAKVCYRGFHAITILFALRSVSALAAGSLGAEGAQKLAEITYSELVCLEHADCTEAVSIIAPLISDQGKPPKLTAVEEFNAIILHGLASEVERLKSLVSQLDRAKLQLKSKKSVSRLPRLPKLRWPRRYRDETRPRPCPSERCAERDRESRARWDKLSDQLTASGYREIPRLIAEKRKTSHHFMRGNLDCASINSTLAGASEK